MSDRHSRTSAPWIAAAVLAALVAVLVVLLVRTNSIKDDNSRAAGNQLAPTADQQRAVQSGAIEAADLTTLSRANYESDFKRALDGTTGTLRKDLLAKKGAYLSAMNAGKFDLKSSVVESAFESQSGDKVLILVTLNGTHVVDKVNSPIATPQRLELTMVKKGAKWLAADFIAVGVQ